MQEKIYPRSLELVAFLLQPIQHREYFINKILLLNTYICQIRLYNTKPTITVIKNVFVLSRVYLPRLLQISSTPQPWYKNQTITFTGFILLQMYILSLTELDFVSKNPVKPFGAISIKSFEKLLVNPLNMQIIDFSELQNKLNCFFFYQILIIYVIINLFKQHLKQKFFLL